MLIIVLVMALVVIAAGVIVAMVAVPRVRGGEKLLTPYGEDLARQARHRARNLADATREKAAEVTTKATEAVQDAAASLRPRTEDEAPGQPREWESAAPQSVSAGHGEPPPLRPAAAAADPAPHVVDLRDPEPTEPGGAARAAGTQGTDHDFESLQESFDAIAFPWSDSGRQSERAKHRG